MGRHNCTKQDLLDKSKQVDCWMSQSLFSTDLWNAIECEILPWICIYLDTNSDILDRTVISTYGSFIAQSLIDWTKQVVTLVQNDAFFPHPIRRELKSILELFTEKNMGIGIKHASADLNQCIHIQSQ